MSALRLVALASPIAGALVLLLVRAGDPALPMDEGMPVVYGDLVLRGFVAHRDFQSLYGPGMPWVVAAAYGVLGASIEVERAVGIAFHVGLVASVVLLALRWGARTATTSGFVAAALLASLHAFASAPIAAVALVCWSIVVLMRPGGGVWPHALAGMLAAAAITIRPDYAVAALVPALPLLAVVRSRAAYAAGVAAGLIPLAAHVVVATPAAVVGDLIVDASRAVPSRRLPLPPASPDDAALLGLVIAAAVFGAAATVTARRSGAPSWRPLAAHALLVVALIPQALQRADTTHIALVAIVAAPLLVLGVARLGGRLRVGGPAGLAGPVAASLVFGALLASVVAAATLAPPAAGAVSRLGRSYPDDPRHARDLRALLDSGRPYLRPGLRLFVGPADLRRTSYNDTILYFLFPDLTPATYYLEMEPLTANAPGSRLAADVSSADVLILTTRWDAWDEPNDSARHGSDEAMAVVHARFRLVARAGEYALYVRST